tara:strand:- start:31 stop:231 length:201 start_codon:yes stop_codon:yes gene_type:complete
MKRVFLTLYTMKGTKLQNRMIWTMQGNTKDVDNLMQELKEIKKFANSEANQSGLKGSDIIIIIEDN